MRRPVLKPCSVVDCDSNAESKRGEFCRLHRYRFERYGATDDPRSPKSCRVCGDRFMPERADATTCSEPGCKAEAKAADTRASDARRDGRPRRARRVAPSRPVVVEPFTRSEVGERDRWRCQTCGGAVDPRLLWPDPDSLSLDLIDPFEPRSFSNCRLVHLRCASEEVA